MLLSRVTIIRVLNNWNPRASARSLSGQTVGWRARCLSDWREHGIRWTHNRNLPRSPPAEITPATERNSQRVSFETPVGKWTNPQDDSGCKQFEIRGRAAELAGEREKVAGES